MDRLLEIQGTPKNKTQFVKVIQILTHPQQTFHNLGWAPLRASLWAPCHEPPQPVPCHALGAGLGLLEAEESASTRVGRGTRREPGSTYGHAQRTISHGVF